MLRAFLLAAAAVLLMGADRAPAVDYRLRVTPAGLDVELRLRGDADGETRLVAPTELASGLAVSGGQAQAIDAAHYVVRHKPGAKLAIRYRYAGQGAGVAALGEALFATPEGWDAVPASVRWQRPPKGWRMASDLDHAAHGRALTVADIRRSVVLAGPAVQVAERGTLRAATLGAGAPTATQLADAAAPALAAERAYWSEANGPFLVTALRGDRYVGRDDAMAVPARQAPDADLRRAIVVAQVLDQFPGRMGPAARPSDWLTQGFAAFLTDRILLRAGLATTDESVAQAGLHERGADPASRGYLLALKWDEAVRLKTRGKADLDDVLARTRDHYRRFPAGLGPDMITGLVSAAWVTAGLDLRPDIARFAETRVAIGLPEEMFDGCLQARITVTPAFDAGFNTEASFAARQVRGVVRRGPAWNSGVRDGMALETWTYKAGDMTRMIELAVRPAGRRAKPRRIAYWPYGDATVETRRLQLTPGMTEAQKVACGRKISGL
ncbi:hypothetical protein [uncultured Phenylobacterium sp.]|uniref:hypothetical protein n=1 Tax=uncultured Phenylobacterium sp. TaxID=349273 RepID=UPI0025F55BE4|nr:hypothetical protein [uncultured Phenylobacterium sp.]